VVERRAPAGELLPALNDDVDILRVELRAVADALRHVGGDQRGARPKEGIVDRGATLSVIQDGPAHEFDGLLGRAIAFLFLRSAHDELSARASPTRWSCRRLSRTSARSFCAHTNTARADTSNAYASGPCDLCSKLVVGDTGSRSARGRPGPRVCRP